MMQLRLTSLIVPIILFLPATACAEPDPQYLQDSNPIAMPVFASGGQVSFPVGKRLKTMDVSYSNLAKGTVNWGDPIGGFYEQHYFFENAKLVGSEQILSVPEENTAQVTQTGGISYEQGGFTVSGMSMLPDGAYVCDDLGQYHRECINSSRFGGRVVSSSDTVVLYVDHREDDQATEPSLQIGIQGNEIIVEEYDRTSDGYLIDNRRVFREGILVEHELVRIGLRETYSVIEGEGVMRRYNSDGELLLEAHLTRERDEYGLMTREVIELPSGAGSIRTWEMEY